MAEEQTYLRVRRRRNAGTALTMIRLEGIEDSRKRDRTDDEAIQDLTASLSLQHDEAQPRKLRKRSTVWRRLDSTSTESEEIDTKAKRRSFRVIDAILSDDEFTDLPLAAELQRHKRRRLKLVETTEDAPSLLKAQTSAPSVAKSLGYRVLDPLSRLVDDSLQSVHRGETTIQQHMNLILTDSRLMDQSWLEWCNDKYGNLLHSCAVWNEVQHATDLLSRNLDNMADTLDAEGRTPYQVAQLSGNTQICAVLEAFGADHGNYVYDIYCMDDEPSLNTDAEAPDALIEEPIACSLFGGVGYWNEKGKLVLEIPAGIKGSATAQSNQDEEDSNDEYWMGNDYPDEDAWGESDSDSNDPCLPDVTYRRRIVCFGEDQNSSQSAHAGSDNGEDGFDAAYGIALQNDIDYEYG
jgi:hypothetical protein